MRWAGHVRSVREKRNSYGIWGGNQKKRGHYEDLDIDVRIILKRIFKK
jgi:hypothetical protein